MEMLAIHLALSVITAPLPLANVDLAIEAPPVLTCGAAGDGCCDTPLSISLLWEIASLDCPDLVNLPTRVPHVLPLS